MRTTLTIDDDVMEAARAMAAQDNRTVGEVVSSLARKSLVRRQFVLNDMGLPVLESLPGGPKVTLELVNALRDGD